MVRPYTVLLMYVANGSGGFACNLLHCVLVNGLKAAFPDLVLCNGARLDLFYNPVALQRIPVKISQVFQQQNLIFGIGIQPLAIQIINLIDAVQMQIATVSRRTFLLFYNQLWMSSHIANIIFFVWEGVVQSLHLENPLSWRYSMYSNISLYF